VLDEQIIEGHGLDLYCVSLSAYFREVISACELGNRAQFRIGSVGCQERHHFSVLASTQR